MPCVQLWGENVQRRMHRAGACTQQVKIKMKEWSTMAGRSGAPWLEGVEHHGWKKWSTMAGR
eukprot:2451934-Pleurochrysis_carterae.AAC.1